MSNDALGGKSHICAGYYSFIKDYEKKPKKNDLLLYEHTKTAHSYVCGRRGMPFKLQSYSRNLIV